MKSVFIHTNRYEQYCLGDQHPFKLYKSSMVSELCHRYGLFDHPWIDLMEPKDAPEDAMLEYHTRDYIDMLKAANSGKFDIKMLEYGLGSSDNPVFKGVFDFSLLVLGATLLGQELISSDRADIIFSPVGGLHHSGPRIAEGFCYVNDIVIAIKRMLKSGYKRIIYVDIDAHHGNGVQDAFYDSDEVLFISLHQSGETIYPFSGFENEMGEGKGRGYTVNIPLSEYTYDGAYVRAFTSIFTPLARVFKPECIVAQIGLDTVKKDPLTNLRLTNNGYCKIIAEIKKSCKKILALGGGGYSVPDVVRGWTLAWSVLNGIEPVDYFQGLVGGAVDGYDMAVDQLYDEPYNLPQGVRKDVDKYLDGKIDFIKEKIFPTHGIS